MAEADGPACAPPGAAPGLAYTFTMIAFWAYGLDTLIGLPDWAAARGIAIAGFGNGVLLLMLAATLLFLLGRMVQFNRPVQSLVGAGCGALLASVAAHLGASLVTRSLVPGAVSGVVLVLPMAGWLLARLPLERRRKRMVGLAGAATFAAGLLAAIWLMAGAS
jgi:Protein of unknown function with HXXEE motif